MATRRFSNTATEATLSGAITSATTTLALTGYAGFPAAPFTAALDRGTSSEEIVLVTAVVGASVTVVRGYDGSLAKSHSSGAPFEHVAVALDFTEANAHVNASVGVHGLAGAVVGTTDEQILTRKSLVAPLLTSPTVTGPMAAVSITLSDTLSVTGAVTFSGAATFSAAATFNGAVTVPAPTATGHPARKAELDALTTRVSSAEGTLTAATAAATAGVLAKRDGAGRLAVATPSASGDAATKGYVDGLAPTYVYDPATGSPAVGPLPKFFMGKVGAAFAGTSFSIPTLDYTLAGFTEPPQVLVTCDQANDVNLQAGVHAVTTTGCWIVVRTEGGGSITTTVPIHFLVIGK